MDTGKPISREKAWSERYGTFLIKLPAHRNVFGPIECAKCGQYNSFSSYRGVYINNPKGSSKIRIDLACVYCFEKEVNEDQ